MSEKSFLEELNLRIRTLERKLAQAKEVENRLRAFNQRMADIIELLPYPTLVIDLHGKVIAWNRAMEQLCGVKSAEMVGQDQYAHAVPFYGEKRPMLVDLVLSWDDEVAGSFPYIRKQGDLLVAETHNPPFKKKPCALRHRARPLYDHHGTIIGAIEVIRDVTAWRTAEEKLKNREELLRAFVDNTPASAVMCDKDMRWLAYSRRCIDDYQLEPKDYVGARHYDIVPDLPDRWKKEHRRVLAGERIRVEEEKFQRKDGRVEWVKRELLPWRDATGQIGGILIFNEIITKRKQAEEKLIESEQRFREMADHIDEVFWVFDWKMQRPVYVSPAYETIWGRSGADLYERYQEWQESIHPDDLDAATASFEKILQTGGGESRQYRIVRPDGQIRWISDRGYAVHDDAGAVVRIVGLAKDITDRKKSEELLRVSEANYRELFNAEPDAIIIVNSADKQIVDANRSALELYGYTREELIGLDPLALSAEPEKSAEHIQLVTQQISEDKPIDTVERLHKKKDGTKFPVEIATGIYISEGKKMICVMIRDITQRRQKEEAVRTLQIQQEAILNNIPDYAWLKDRQSRFVAVNKAFGQACGTKPDDIVGKTDLDVWPQKLAERYRADDNEVMESGRRKVVDEPLDDADGRRTWIETIKTPIHDENGEVIGTAGIARDITERRQAQVALQESEERFAKAFHNSPDAIVITLASDGTIIEANESFFRMSGYERREVIGFTAVELGLWADPQDREQYLQAMQKTGSVRDLEYAYRIKSGEIRLGRVSGSLINLGGEPCVLGTIRDITESKKAAEALQAEKERLVVTLRSIGDGVITTDRSGSITLINQVAEKLTGWKQAEAVGQPLDRVFQIVDEFTRKPCENPVQQVISQGQIVGLGNHTVLIGKDGQEIVIADSGAPIWDSEKRLIGVVLVFRDITETRRMEDEILKIEKLESLGVLAGGIAHDFNNFLAGIIGNISLAKMEATAPEPIFERLEEMEKAAMRAKNLTQQLLTFSKGGEPVRRASDLTHLVSEAIQFAIRGSNVRCEFRFDSDSLFSEVDEGQLAQVLHNLTLNAIQAMPEGGEILVGGELIELPPNNSLSLDAGPYARLSIRDHGTGIKKEHLKKVFDPYFTTKQKGSGLGLAVAHSVIDKHKGRIALESELGTGTTFFIYLPALMKTEVKGRSGRRVMTSAVGRILVMDDEDFIRKLAAQMLQKMGFTVSVASDGEEAIRLYRQALADDQAYDAVILDLTIPGGMGGKETISKLLDLDSEVKAIVSSGYSNDPVLSNYAQYGFQQAVSKPYRIHELSEALQAILQLPKPNA